MSQDNIKASSTLLSRQSNDQDCQSNAFYNKNIQYVAVFHPTAAENLLDSNADRRDQSSNGTSHRSF